MRRVPRVGEEALGTAGEADVAGGADELGFRIVADLVGEQNGPIISQPCITAKDRAGIADFGAAGGDFRQGGGDSVKEWREGEKEDGE